MGTAAFLLGLAVVPVVASSAFVPSLGVKSSAFTSASGASVATRAGPVTAEGATFATAKVFMSVAERGHDRDQASSSRGQFIGRLSAGVAAATAAASAGGCAAPALADSTGKYSSKATARKRYLPRIVKMVNAFQLLKKDIDSGSAVAKSEFFADILPDSVAAMDLYGSSMKKGETPDSKSRALQQLAQDFGSTCNSIAKSLGKKGGGADAGKAYDKASAILVQYLKGVELDPLGSDAYN
ncbi:unnamed protein product [Pylaiella littoralis]